LALFKATKVHVHPEVSYAKLFLHQTDSFYAFRGVATEYLSRIHPVPRHLPKRLAGAPPSLILGARIFAGIYQRPYEMHIAHVMRFPFFAGELRRVIDKTVVASDDVELVRGISRPHQSFLVKLNVLLKCSARLNKRGQQDRMASLASGSKRLRTDGCSHEDGRRGLLQGTR